MWLPEVVDHFQMFAVKFFKFLTICKNSPLVLASLVMADFAIATYDKQTSIVVSACVC
jgi:hypothetical protein